MCMAEKLCNSKTLRQKYQVYNPGKHGMRTPFFCGCAIWIVCHWVAWRNVDPLKTLFSSHPHSPQFKWPLSRLFFCLRLLFGSGAISQKQPQKTLRVSGNTGNNSDSRAMPIHPKLIFWGGSHSHKTTQILLLPLPHYSQTFSIFVRH